MAGTRIRASHVLIVAGVLVAAYSRMVTPGRPEAILLVVGGLMMIAGAVALGRGK